MSKTIKPNKDIDMAFCSTLKTFVLEYSFTLVQLCRSELERGKLVLLINSQGHSKGLAATEVSFSQQ